MRRAISSPADSSGPRPSPSPSRLYGSSSLLAFGASSTQRRFTMGSGKTAVRQGGLFGETIQDILTAVSNGAVAHYTGSADVLDFPGIASLDTAGVDALTL